MACVDSRTGRLLDQARFDSLLGDQQAVAGAVSESGRAERGGKCSLVPGWSYRQELPSRGVEIQRLAQGLAVSYGGHTWYLKVTPSH